jgi:hypothetical protein
MVDAYFQYALTAASGVAWISHLHAANAANNVRNGVGIPEAAQPA